MKSVVSLPCDCGREIRAANPAPGTMVRCLYCGQSTIYQPEGHTLNKGPEQTIEKKPDPKWGKKPLVCNRCGGEFEIRYGGPEGKDRVAVCRYCSTKIDLPESRGSTKLTRSHSPDGTFTTTKVTNWESMSETEMPDLDEKDLMELAKFQADNPDIEFKDEELEFDSIDEMKKHLYRTMPRDMADNFIREVEGKMPQGDLKSTISSTSKTWTTSEVKTDTDVLSKVGKWFRKK